MTSTTETVTQRGIATEALKFRAQVAVHHGLDRINVWTPDGWKPPKGFPRRQLLCCPTMGGKTWDVDAARLLKWIEAQE